MASGVGARPWGRRSDHAPGSVHPRGAGPGPGRLGRIVAAAVLAVGALAPATVAAAEGLELTTPYPAVAVAPGSDVSFDLTVETAASSRVDLELTEVPDGWDASIRGGGFVVDGVQTTAGEPTEVTLEVTVPAEASGEQRIVVRADDGSTTTDLPLALRIEAEAAGDVQLTTDFPQLRGPSDATYRYTLDLANDTPEDLTFAVNADAPEGTEGWQVTAKVTSQDQAASAIVEAGGTVGLEVEVVPPATVAAGTYPIVVTATSGARQVSTELGLEITGSYGMTLSTPDDRLNVAGTAGGEIRQTLVIENTGTAPLEGLTLTSSDAPTGWTVSFDPETPAAIAPGQTGQVTAIIQPSGDAIAGDYNVTISAANDNATAEQSFRVTVETSLLWGLIGVALIIAVLVGLWFVFQRYGRR
jgi:uncharacterized membrane protein